jgi:phenylalanyl-tRNA synthetase beta chain
MKISVDWIKDFVDLPEELSDRDISERITLGVCEVEGFERIGSVLNNVTVAAVTGVEPHPDADKLKLATVDLGGGKTARVVCGAPNCRTGIKVRHRTSRRVHFGTQENSGDSFRGHALR